MYQFPKIVERGNDPGIYNVSNDKKFNELCVLKGFRGSFSLDNLSVGEAATALAWFNSSARSIIWSIRKQHESLNFPPIYFGYINCDTINGFVAGSGKESDLHFIGITNGAIQLFFDISLRLMSDPDMLRYVVGYSYKEDIARVRTYGLYTSISSIPLEGDPSPNSKHRFDVAVAMWEYACRYLLMHEMAHIWLGHLAFLQNEQSENLLEVNTDKTTTSVHITRQALELDADLLAGFQTPLYLMSDIVNTPVPLRTTLGRVVS